MPAGKVVNAQTGANMPGVTIWQLSADGTNATVLGYTDTGGTFSVSPDPGYSLLFSQDGFDNSNLPGMAGAGNIVELEPESAVTVTIKKNSWLWILAAVLGFYILESKPAKR
jgi:hypothetical protein